MTCRTTTRSALLLTGLFSSLAACPGSDPEDAATADHRQIEARDSGVDAFVLDSGNTRDVSHQTDVGLLDVGPVDQGLSRDADPYNPDNAVLDSDCDGLSDAEEFAIVYASGGQTDPGDADSDGDGLLDGLEVGRTRSPDVACAGFVGDGAVSSRTDPTAADSDGDGLVDGLEDADHDGVFDSGETDPNHPDTDRDGLCDGPLDVAPLCVGGDAQPLVPAAAPDTDGDGLVDSVDLAPTDPDRDGDGLCDGPGDGGGTCLPGEDLNGDGVVNANETDPDRVDSDCDGLSDGEERALGSNPRKADTDGDLLPDGLELGRTVSLDAAHCPGTAVDGDPSTTTSALARDSDGDGLADGLEDADRDGVRDGSETDPADPDSDDDGLCDGPLTVAGVCVAGEDRNGNGVVDVGESDPRVADQGGVDGGAHDADPYQVDNATRDTDCDGLSDAEEFGTTYPGGGQTDPGNPDSDGDGIWDGVEVGRTASVDARCASFVGDGDPTTHTDPTVADSDGDGLADGAEDVDHDGRRDSGELDPRHPDSDGDGLCDGPLTVTGVCVGGDPNPHTAEAEVDSDGDGLPDAVDSADADPDADDDGLCDGPASVVPDCVGGEDLNADGVLNAGETSPVHPDTDCDGLSDGEERALGTNPRKRDTDGDLIPDGVELGRTSNLEPGYCTGFVGDADPGTTTDPLAVDSDGDGIHDGIEDANHDGAQDGDETDPASGDTDGDGLCDGPPRTLGTLCTGGEDLNANGVVDVGETDPRVAGGSGQDSDGDGILDHIEDGVPCLSSAMADSDGDGLCDGPLAVAGVCAAGEDANLNGRVDDGETDPCLADTDCDGLVDGASYGGYTGEIPSGTSALDPDSDGDGLLDGLELGIVGAAIPPGTGGSCGFVEDADPSSTTVPTDADSDDDGVVDGAEDANQNGAVDPGELDPEVSDATGPTLDACATANLVEVVLSQASNPDLLFATAQYGGADSFSERTTITLAGETVGQMFYNPSHQVAAFALSLVPTGGDATASAAELSRRAALGTLSAPVTQTFTTWDGFAGSVVASYDDGSAGTVKARANAIATILLGGSPSGLLSAGGGNGPFELQLLYVRRSGNRLVVAGALIPTSRYSGTSVFRLEDLGNGSALGQFGDGLGTQCDRFALQDNAVVDFLWIIDNSGSMYDEQTTVADTATLMTNQLAGSTLDWRLGVITTDLDFRSVPDWGTYEYTHGASYDTSHACDTATVPPYWPVYCPFTTDPARFEGCVQSLYTCGGSTESAFAPFACALGTTPTNGPSPTYCWDSGTGFYTLPLASYRLLPKASSSAYKIRPDAKLAVIMMTDEPEQSDGINGVTTTVQNWADLFNNYDGAGSSAFVAGILCPPGDNCTGCTGGGCMPSDARYSTFIQAMGGIEGDISDYTTIPDTIERIITAVAGNTSPYTLSKRPISSTIKVATDATTVGACTTDDIPRSREHGWDYDGTTGNIVFYGDCRPVGGTDPEIAVSYRYFVDRSADPDGPGESCECTAPEVCDPDTLQCYCPPDCGVADIAPEEVCDTATCQLTCRPDCGASCPGNSVCNPAPETCACECPGDCGGQAPATDYVCQRDPDQANYCEWLCPACPGQPANDDMICDLLACAWTCPDCGDCPGFASCDESTCACACTQSLSCDVGYRWDETACDCVCNAAALGCDPGFVADAELCACVCADDCGGLCASPRTCNPSLCQCLCPADCGVGSMPAGKTCDTATCQLVCLPDCGQSCPGNALCNPGSADCACECPLDCGGQAPGPNFTCDRDPAHTTFCTYTCTGCPGDPPGPGMVCDLQTCDWVCSGCEGCSGFEVCDLDSCACACEVNLSCPAGFVWSADTCACVCDTGALSCGATYQADADLCACVCADDCNGTCGVGMRCNTSLCTCIPSEG